MLAGLKFMSFWFSFRSDLQSKHNTNTKIESDKTKRTIARISNTLCSLLLVAYYNVGEDIPVSQMNVYRIQILLNIT